MVCEAFTVEGVELEDATVEDADVVGATVEDADVVGAGFEGAGVRRSMTCWDRVDVTGCTPAELTRLTPTSSAANGRSR